MSQWHGTLKPEWYGIRNKPAGWGRPAPDRRAVRRRGMAPTGRPSQQGIALLRRYQPGPGPNVAAHKRRGDMPEQPRRYLRGYTFACVCGRLASGVYAMEKPNEAFDPERAVCGGSKGAPSPARGSWPSRKMPDQPHPVGCGRTLAKSDAERVRKAEAA